MISNVVIFNYKVEVSNVMSYHQANKNPLKASFDWTVNLCFLSCHAHGHMYNFYSFTLRLIMQRKTKSMWIQMEQEQALIDFIIQDQTPTFPQTSLRWERPHQIMALLHKEKEKEKKTKNKSQMSMGFSKCKRCEVWSVERCYGLQN